MSGVKPGVDDTRGLTLIAVMFAEEARQNAAKIRADYKKLQREVVKMHLDGSKPDAIANRFGIAPDEAAAIVKAFKAFLSKKAF